MTTNDEAMQSYESLRKLPASELTDELQWQLIRKLADAPNGRWAYLALIYCGMTVEQWVVLLSNLVSERGGEWIRETLLEGGPGAGFNNFQKQLIREMIELKSGNRRPRGRPRTHLVQILRNYAKT
jgi:hypothetical protein